MAFLLVGMWVLVFVCRPSLYVFCTCPVEGQTLAASTVQLTALNMADETFDAVEAQAALVAALRGQRHLTSLNLSMSLLEPTGLAAVARAVTASGAPLVCGWGCGRCRRVLLFGSEQTTAAQPVTFFVLFCLFALCLCVVCGTRWLWICHRTTASPNP